MLQGDAVGITLTGFAAQAHHGHEADQIVVRWQTSRELDVIGFNLYAGATEEFEGATARNTKIIPSQGPTGGSYEFTFAHDPASEGDPYQVRIWLVAVQEGDRRERYGPIKISETVRIFLPIVLQQGGEIPHRDRIYLPAIVCANHER